MHRSHARILCLLGVLFVLCTSHQGPSYVFAGTAQPGKDPLFSSPGNLGGTRAPKFRPVLSTIREGENDPLFLFPGGSGGTGPRRWRPSLSTIPEGGGLRPRPSGREQLAANPRLRGHGLPPFTEFFHHGNQLPPQGLQHPGPAPRGPIRARRPRLLEIFQMIYGRPDN
uniref:Uncharacterized protein n=1 Tax=Rhipicephalus appendiculatus TaxID=34631 RepID=A0A131YD40_RHIAP